MRTFLVSDTHFGHANICKFTDFIGNKIRPWDDVKQMDEDMVVFWNETVEKNDRVIHLGDVTVNPKHLPILNRLNGKKILIQGNHDISPARDLLDYFEDVRSCMSYGGNYFLSHIPIHPERIKKNQINIHGHLHQQRVMKETGKIDPRYWNVSVEHTNFRPILFENFVNRMKNEKI